jgi:type IV secretory pathway TrbD component
LLVKKAPVRLSLLRRIAWLGGDRRLVGIAGVCCAALSWTMFIGFRGAYGLFLLLPGAIFLGLLWVARRMNAADPWMLDILIRHFQYARYYGPRANLRVGAREYRSFTKKARWR